eukprot:TRINITY_DN1477_c1_g1_i4.p1 TRINITY_DN1477_c1_g1~~TRINITY_DN1477_c1_g1_i4.p1  ORF type:complete len:657 (+),score=109.09 TRINITY_DN1477_c1_g1_i4:178-2148(+)
MSARNQQIPITPSPSSSASSSSSQASYDETQPLPQPQLASGFSKRSQFEAIIVLCLLVKVFISLTVEDRPHKFLIPSFLVALFIGAFFVQARQLEWPLIASFRLTEGFLNDSGILIGTTLLPLVFASMSNPFNGDDYFLPYLGISLSFSLVTILSLLVSDKKKTVSSPRFMLLLVFAAAVLARVPLRPIGITLATIVALVVTYYTVLISILSFPRCFTLGEGTIVASTITLIFWETAHYTHVNLLGGATIQDWSREFISQLGLPISTEYINQSTTTETHDPLLSFINKPSIEKKTVYIVMIGMFTSIITLGFITNFALVQLRRLALGGAKKGARARSWANWLTVFYTISGLFVLGIFLPWIETISGVNPIIWVFRLANSSYTRLFLSSFWAITLVLSIGYLYRLDKKKHPEEYEKVNTDEKGKPPVKVNSSPNTTQQEHKNKSKEANDTPVIIIRKYFHLLAIVLFLPGLVMDPVFMALAFMVATCLFILVELLKYGRVPPISTPVVNFMGRFLDAKDQGVLTLTHIYLLIGCAAPLWLSLLRGNMSHEGDFQNLAPYAGILIIGVGDTLAAFVGFNYGKIKLPGTKKTLEGALSGVAGVILTIFLVTQFSGFSYSFSQWSWLLFSTFLSGMLEGFTTQIDNLILPLFYFAMLNLA